MSLVAKIQAAVGRAKAGLGDLIITGTLSRVTNTGYLNLQPTQSTQAADVEGFYSSWDDEDRKSFNVLNEDLKFYAFPADLIPKVGDSFSVGGISYEVVAALPTKAGTTTVITLIQLRA